MAVQDLEGYDEVIQKFLDTLTPEQRLAGLAPEQRLAGLAPEQVVLTLPEAFLKGFSEEFLATLPEPVRAAIRARVGR